MPAHRTQTVHTKDAAYMLLLAYAQDNAAEDNATKNAAKIVIHYTDAQNNAHHLR